MKSKLKLSEILELPGNAFQSMEYSELAEVTHTLAEAARKRIKRVPEGPAYEKLKKRAEGKGRNVKANALYIKDDTVRIHQNFTGNNRMSMSDLRVLRKELSLYLKDETSTKKGLKLWRKKQQKEIDQYKDVLDLGDAYDYTEDDQIDSNKWIWDIFDTLTTDEDYITFGREYLGWASDDINEMAYVYKSGKRTKARSAGEFRALVVDKAYKDMMSMYGPHEEPMPNFDYDTGKNSSGGVFK